MRIAFARMCGRHWFGPPSSAGRIMARASHMLVAHPEAPAKTLDALIKAAKANPGMLSFASFGTGTSPHLAIEMLKAQSGIDLVHVP